MLLVGAVVLLSGGQSIVLSGVPSIVDVDESTATVSEDKTQFDVDVDSNLGESQSILVRLLNTAGNEATSTLSLTAPTGVNMSVEEVDNNILTIDDLGVSSWILTMPARSSIVAGEEWQTVTTDSDSNSVGQHTSIAAVDTDITMISYYDATDGNLKFARTVNGGESASDWTTVASIVTSGDVGRYTDIAAVDSNTAHISYYDVSNTALKVATTNDGGSNWSSANVDSSGDVGRYTSIAALNANVFVSYYDATNGDLVVAKSTNSGTSWTANAVDSIGDVGMHTAIALPDADTVIVGYYDATNQALKIARSIDGGGSWATAVIDSSGDVGREASIVAVDAQTLFVSYYDATNDDLKAAKSVDGGSAWSVSVIDSTGEVGRYASIAASDTSNVFISYQSVTDSSLKVARSTDGGGTWNLVTLDSTGGVGEYTSITAPSASAIAVSYYDGANNNLKFARSIRKAELLIDVERETDDPVGLYTISGAVTGQ